MRITLCGRSALALLRSRRAAKALSHVRRVDLWEPTPGPGKRWSVGKLRALLPSLCDRDLEVAVPSASKRIKTKGVSNTVYAHGLPSNAFLDLGDGIAISSPELLFVELAPIMGFITHLLLGCELCGTFSRDALDPRDGEVKFFVEAATSVKRISEFLEEAHALCGVAEAREALPFVCDNAWAPTEALIATMAASPVYRMGYGLADIVLNKRIHVGESGSRVPDLLFGETGVGLNYDGEGHLNLDAVAQAAWNEAVDHFDNASDPSQAHAGDVTFPVNGERVRRAKRVVRNKVVDDLRRNRSLGAKGYIVFPATKEDLYECGGLDRLMLQVYDAIERYAHVSMAEPRSCLSNRAMARRRQEIIWAVMPGPVGRQYARRLLRTCR